MLVGCWAFVLAGIAFAGLALFLVVRRGGDLRLLVTDGVPMQARVVEITRFQGKAGGISASTYLRYEYVDPFGATHRHRSLVSHEFAVAHPEGSSLEIVVSASRPAVSAPRQLVEQSRRALARDTAETER